MVSSAWAVDERYSRRSGVFMLLFIPSSAPHDRHFNLLLFTLHSSPRLFQSSRAVTSRLPSGLLVAPAQLSAACACVCTAMIDIGGSARRQAGERTNDHLPCLFACSICLTNMPLLQVAPTRLQASLPRRRSQGFLFPSSNFRASIWPAWTVSRCR